jgi:pyridinium-3,5-biscarboxylic acid mononucleotide sulfurtransferase
MVELAEDFLKCLGFGQLRVRAHGNLARIELPDNDMKKAVDYREEISNEFKSVGFSYITLDLEGFRSGSMNEVLTKTKKG